MIYDGIFLHVSICISLCINKDWTWHGPKFISETMSLSSVGPPTTSHGWIKTATMQSGRWQWGTRGHPNSTGFSSPTIYREQEYIGYIRYTVSIQYQYDSMTVWLYDCMTILWLIGHIIPTRKLIPKRHVHRLVISGVSGPLHRLTNSSKYWGLY